MVQPQPQPAQGEADQQRRAVLVPVTVSTTPASGHRTPQNRTWGWRGPSGDSSAHRS